MNKKLVKKLKIVAIILIIILIGEIIFIGYHHLFEKKKSVYFEGINAVVSNNEYYAAVGSNNDNDMHYEKAKISFYNMKKEKTYEKIYNVGFNSAFFGVILDGSDVVCVGSYEKTDEDRNNSVRKALIVKYDKLGNVVFEKDLSILDNSKFTSIVKYGDYYYVTGQSVYKSTKIGSEAGGALIAKYDKDGNLVWSKTYGSSKSGIYNDLIIEDDYIYVVGNDENYLGILCKYNLDGELVEYNDYKSTDNIGFSGIVSYNGRIYISGANRNGNDLTDAMIVMYTMDCKYIKQVTYDAKGTERFNKLILDDDNNIIAIGTMYTVRKHNHNTVDEYNYDGIIAKYDSDLVEKDVVTYGDERDDYFTDVMLINNKYVVSSYSSYEDGSYMSKFVSYSKALKVLEVE